MPRCDGFIQIEEDALAQHDAEFESNMRHLFALIVTASLLTLLFALAFAYLIYREAQHRLKSLVHLETRHLLEVQEETNQQLQQANVTLQVSEEKLAVTLNSIGDAVIATDAEGRVTLPESPCRTAHRLDAGGSRRPPGGRDLSHHQPGNPPARHDPGAWKPWRTARYRAWPTTPC